MRIIQISDTHLSRTKPHFADNWPPLAAWIAAQNPNLVIHTGDVTVDGADVEDDLRYAAELMRQLGVRFRAVPGNHDVGDAGRPGQPVTDERLARWRTYFGLDRWIEDIEGVRLIGLNAMLLGSGNREEATQAAWLDAVMEGAGDRHIAWFLHRPLFLDSREEADTGYWSVRPEPRARLIELVRRHSVALVASGHLHKAYQTVCDGTRYLWCPASSFLVGPEIQPRCRAKSGSGQFFTRSRAPRLNPVSSMFRGSRLIGSTTSWTKSIRTRPRIPPRQAEIFFFVSVSVWVHPRCTTGRSTEMAEILGLGVTHWPTLCLPNEGLTSVFKRTLTAPNVEARYKDPANWPDELIAELGNDDGLSAANRCGERFGNDFRAIRKILDDFNPDLVVIWGDDQYENFREDIVPAFCLLGYDANFELKPWHTNGHGGNGGKPNRWGEPGDWALKLHGHREAAKYLATGLIERGIDMAYAYKPLHDPMAHAFTNTFLYLDWDRAGFPYPAIPFAINCYGRTLIHAKGGLAHLFQPPRPADEAEDPPAPAPWRCMEVGAAVAEVLAASPYRTALIASSSWSHAFLSPKNGYLWPDHEGDRLLFDAVSRADYATWRKRSLAEMEYAGQHEMLNWMALIGAMEALDRRPVIQDYMETYILASDKCFLSFPP